MFVGMMEEIVVFGFDDWMVLSEFDDAVSCMV